MLRVMLLPNLGKKKVSFMFHRLFATRAEKQNAHAIYKALVSQARSAAFYERMDVDDTIEGRFDMILLHLYLVDARLALEGEKYVRLRRYVQEVMISDLDRSFRELGVGDMSVGKEMKKVGAAWMGRKSGYAEAMANPKNEQILEAALIKNIYRGEKKEGLPDLASYILSSSALLADAELTGPADCEMPFLNL